MADPRRNERKPGNRIAAMADPQADDSLAKFAKLHGLEPASTAQLPDQGSTLALGGGVEGAAIGKLAGDLDATLALLLRAHG